MRSIAIVAALSLLGSAAAQPSKHRRHERLHQLYQKIKRQDDVVVTEIQYVTESVPSVTVYVDANGKILYSVADPVTTPAPSASSAAPPPAAYTTTTSTAPPVLAVTTKPSTTQAPPPPPSTTAAPAPVSPVAPIVSPPAPSPVAPVSPVPPVSNNDPTSIKALAYSPYKGHYGSTSCKSTSDVALDFTKIDASQYNAVRIYGTDCNQVANVLAAAKPKGLKIFAGVYDVTQAASEIGIMAAAANGDWSSFHTISIGNEAVSSGVASIGTVLSALSSAKTLLKSKGYNGPVVAVDTFMAAKQYPALCQQSDYTAVNMHPYWDYNTAAADAGTFMTTQIGELKDAAVCGSKSLVISETGWPSSGTTKGKAVCSQANQAAAISSIKSALGDGFVLLGAYDDWWKNPGPDGVEQMFGLMGTAPSG